MSEPRTARGSYAKGRARREEILRAALEVFAAQGYRGGSLVAVARRVGLTDAALFHHFRSKEQLLMELLQLCEEEDRAWVRAMTDAEEAGGPAVDRILHVGRRIVARPEVARLASTLAAESLDEGHPAHTWFRDRARRLRRELADGLRDEQRLGTFPATADPDLVATHLLAALEGLKNHWLLDPENVDVVAALADYLAPYRTPDQGRPEI